MKAVLVIDMPNYCLDCPCYNKSKLYCQVVNEMFTDEISNKPSWCPLRPMPQQLPDVDLWEPHWYIRGYNDCLDEILGETE